MTEASLEQRIQWFEESEQASEDSRKLSERDRDYYDGKQLTDPEIKELRKRGQPETIINRVKRKVDFLTGSEVSTRTDPKAFPRNQDDEEAADAATSAIRFVADNNEYETTRSDVWENMVIEGFGGAVVVVRRKRNLRETTALNQGEIEIKIIRVAWDRLFFDPHSAKRDFSDAKYKGILAWMDLEDAKTRWPGKEDVLDSMIEAATTAETYDDKPKFKVWVDAKRKRIRVVQMFYRSRGSWYTSTFTSGGDLEPSELSPYVDEDGTPECELHIASSHVDRDNNRYGYVRELISPQDEINKRRSKALHMLTARQTKGTKGAVDDVRHMKQELGRPDGHVEVNPSGELEVLPNTDFVVGQFNLLQEAKGEIDGMGPNASLQGKQDENLSGRALLAQQQAGFVELGRGVDARRQFDLDIYRAVWNRVRQFWDQQKWVRVTDDEKNVQFVGFNRPVTLFEDQAEQFQEATQRLQQVEEQAGQLQDPVEQQVMQQNITQQKGLMVQRANEAKQTIVRMENVPAEMMVDIVVEQSPDTANIKQEQFEMMARVPGVPIDLLIELSSMPDKDKILEKLQEQRAAQQQAAVELQVKAAQAEIDKTKSETVKNMADAKAKSQPQLVQ